VIAKAFQDITKDDIEALVRDQVTEGRSLEYKAALPGNSDGEKKEFLADVSSFANAGGGDILYGVGEAAGAPTAATGVALADPDAEIRRLENILRDGLDPRVPSVQIKEITGFATGSVLLVRIPKSWTAPHMIKFQNSSRFFTRNNAGKYQMDVVELRSAFLLSESVGERVRRFRDERLSRIISNETPVRLPSGAKMVLHLVPLTSATLEIRDAAVGRVRLTDKLPPLGASGYSSRYNLDGFLTHSGSRKSANDADGYCQLFRTGAVESVYAALVKPSNNRRFIPSVAYERYVINAASSQLQLLESLQVPLPIVGMLSMLGVAGAELSTHDALNWGEHSPIDRDVLILPDVLIENYQIKVTQTFRPIFDAVWNASGYERSFNYDNDGNWKGH
jgi:hypothetical protein